MTYNEPRFGGKPRAVCESPAKVPHGAAILRAMEAEGREQPKDWRCPFHMKDGCDMAQGWCACGRDSRHKDAAALRAEGDAHGGKDG